MAQAIVTATAAAATVQANATATEQAATAATRNALIAYVDALVKKAGIPNKEPEGILTGRSWFYPRLYIKNFVADVQMFNAGDPAIHSWDYGFRFRMSGDKRYSLTLHSGGTWRLAFPEKAAADHVVVKTVGNGKVQKMNLSPTGSNRIRLVASDKSGFLYVNSDLVAMLDLSEHTSSGEIILVAGSWVGNDFPGMSVRFKDLVISGLP